MNRKLRPRRGSRLAAITSGGAIPETALFTVVAEPEGIVVGTLDEDFAVESNAGDIMLLGNTSWRIRRVEGKSGRVLVEDAHGAPPSVPFWRGEAPARTQELSAHVAGLRKEISDRLRDTSPVGISQSQPAVAETVAWLKEECGLDDSGAEQAIEYILQGRAVLGDVPTQDTIIAEHPGLYGGDIEVRNDGAKLSGNEVRRYREDAGDPSRILRGQSRDDRRAVNAERRKRLEVSLNPGAA